MHDSRTMHPTDFTAATSCCIPMIYFVIDGSKPPQHAKDLGMPIASIIVPIHNSENHLAQCLESLLAQSLQDFEIICVDDGSTDSSSSILDVYSRSDARIRVIRQNNQGAGIARNVGIDAAQGKYLLFIDGDDFVSPNLLKETTTLAEETNADIVLFNADKFDNARIRHIPANHFLNTNLLPSQNPFSPKDIADCLFTVTTPAPWNKLFLTDFIRTRNIRFQSLQNTNDLRFTLSALSEANRISWIDSTLTSYRTNTGQSTQAKRGNAPQCFAMALQGLKEELEKRGTYHQFEFALAKRALSTSLYILESCRFYNERIAALDAISSDRYDVMNLFLENVDMSGDATWEFQQSKIRNAIATYRRRTLAPIDSPIELIAGEATDFTPLVSVIVPVCNTEPYLEDAVYSLLNQTLEKIEIICIDDGSTDASLEKLVSLSKDDERIRVYSQKNRGLAYTRNKGKELALGKYLYFMDSDDILEAEALSNLTRQADQQNLDMLLFDGQSFFDTDDLSESVDIDYFARAYQRPREFGEVKSGQELFANLWQNRCHYVSACLYLIRNDFVKDNNLTFPNGALHEDNAFIFTALMEATRAAHTKKQYFKRRVRSDSIMTRPVSFEHSYGYFACSEAMKNSYYAHRPFLSDEVRSCALAHIADIVNLSRSRFAQIESAERYAKNGLTYDHEAFEREIAEPVEKADRLADEIGAVRSSRSYRLGHFIFTPYRIAKRVLKKR